MIQTYKNKIKKEPWDGMIWMIMCLESCQKSLPVLFTLLLDRDDAGGRGGTAPAKLFNIDTKTIKNQGPTNS
jgi:hypothetical protein